MSFDLGASEVRVLGCLMEKQRTTPDVYPLSLNALRLACNQSTNRDPVVEYDEAVIRDALHRLERRGFVRLASGAGSRAAKYRHLLADALPMSADERAVMCVLMLRGAQTPGELKQRTERMHSFADLAGVHDTLGRLIERELVARLERRPGHKEERYAQLLQAQQQAPAAVPAGHGGEAGADGEGNGREESPGSEEDDASRVAGLSGRAPANGQSGRPEQSVPALAEWAELCERVARLEREVTELRAAQRAPMRDPVQP